MIARIRSLNAVLDPMGHDVLALALRNLPDLVFLRSGRTRVEGLFTITDSIFYLFNDEYAPPLIPSDRAAAPGTKAEPVPFILPVLGLFTRLAAPGLLGMTAVIVIFVFPDAGIAHALWAAAFLALIARGPGARSLVRWPGLDGPSAMVPSPAGAAATPGEMNRWT